MILNAENRQSFVLQARDRLVVEINVRDFDFGGQARGIDGKTVIVRGDFDFSGRSNP